MEKEIKKEFISVKEFAAKVGMSVSFINNITTDGEIKTYMFGNKKMYKVEDVQAWIENKARESA